jgi:hypothetical protein
MNSILSIKKPSYLQEEFIVKRRELLQNLAASPDELPDCTISALKLFVGNTEIHLQPVKNKLMAEQESLRKGKKIYW